MGISGRIARFFLESRLTPLVALLALLLGAFAVVVTPREEEPQINVTMANVLIPFPGASARDVETLVAIPAEQVISQIQGLEHVFSVSKPGLAVITAQFKVGVPRTEALVRLYDTIHSNRDWLPAQLNVGEPIVKPKGIDDVPIVTLTLWTPDVARGAFDLERVAHALEAELKRVPGHARSDDDRRPRSRRARAARSGAASPRSSSRRPMSGRRCSRPMPRCHRARLSADNRTDRRRDRAVPRRCQGRRRARRRRLRRQPGLLVRRRAHRRRSADACALRLVRHGSRRRRPKASAATGEFPAVTIAVTKKPGENAVDVAERVARARRRTAQHGDSARASR